MNAIREFQGEYRWLSNFHFVEVRFEGTMYPSVEHAYQAAKTHPSARGPFTTGTPGEAKRRGRRIEIRADWDQVKIAVMRGLIREKFSSGSVLAVRLIETGCVTIEEGNTWNDRFWGVCRGAGENHLGRLLMERRAELVLVDFR